jgi:hypothetical protein
MKPKVYIETSIVSYLTARLSRDLIVAANQQVTQDWWEKRRDDFDLFVSQLVIREASVGDEQASGRRLAVLAPIPVLDIDAEVEALARSLLDQGVLPERAAEDALHIAIASVHGIDYLLTWNCRHIANAEIQRVVRAVCLAKGYDAPIVCTPAELMGDQGSQCDVERPDR